jgi:hypothetical protein
VTVPVWPEPMFDYPLDQQMYVYRFMRDGQPREAHHRRHEQPEPARYARELATETGNPVAWTAADIGANYSWRWRNDDYTAYWHLALPRGMKREMRVESCPNGCGSTR